MYEHLSRRVDHVIKLANEIARGFDQEYVGTEHVLLAIAREDTGLGARVLRSHGISEGKIDAEVRRLLKESLEDTWVFGRLPGTPHFRNVIAQAIEEARGLKSKAVCTEHLLLGLLAEKGSVAHNVLKTLGLNAKMVREAVIRSTTDTCGDAVGAG
jgi:ATP-dependent Clp protease ATP-binding subunit ClpC